MQRRAKIGGTLGPACDDENVLERLIEAGLEVARLNFSHGEIAEHRRRVRRLRAVAKKAGKHVAVLADLQGPRFRVGRLEGGALDLVDDSMVELCAGRTRSTAGTVPVPYKALAREIRPGNRIMIDDGNLALRVERVRDQVISCHVERGGRLTDGKGINLPGVKISVPSLTPKDRRDLRLAVDLGADWLAVSFVRRPEDVQLARRLTKRAGRELPVMAKIEREEAIERLPDIIEVADALLVARGDLGVELPPERVPVLQKEIIEAANAAGRPVMTATQMLDSMRSSPRPTRAEASDVANTALDGSGCLLLTAETAVGRFPVESVQTMARIIGEAEASGRTHLPASPGAVLTISQTACHAACDAAKRVGAAYLVAFTQSGSTAFETARFRPGVPIVAYTPSRDVARRLALLWGVESHELPRMRTIDELMRALERALLDAKRVRKGEIVVVLSGSPIGVPGTTNLINVHRVGTARRRPS